MATDRASFAERLAARTHQGGTLRTVTGTAAILYLPAGLRAAIASGRVIASGTDADGGPNSRGSDADDATGRPKTAMVCVQSHNASEHGTALLQQMLPGRRFPFPKSLYAVEDTLRLFVKDKPDAVVLDFFAGSGTTAHAVARLNRQDGGRRQSIMVTNNEVSADEARDLRATWPSAWRRRLGGAGHLRAHHAAQGDRGDHGRDAGRGRRSRATTSSPTSSRWPTASRRTPRSWSFDISTPTTSTWASRSTTSRRCCGSGPAARDRSRDASMTLAPSSRTSGPTATASCSTRTAGAASCPPGRRPHGPHSSSPTRRPCSLASPPSCRRRWTRPPVRHVPVDVPA